MIQYRKILELDAKGVTQRTIASSTGHSRDKIREVIKRAKVRELTDLTEEMTNHWLDDYLFPENQSTALGYLHPDWEYIHKELLKKNVTLKLLHKEYEQQARLNKQIPYAYRTFCEKYGHFGRTHKLTMPIHRKPGEILETDWTGAKCFVKNRDTGEMIPAYVFVAALPFSQYFYVEAFFDMKTRSWLAGHIHAFEFFGGVPENVIPDNLKTGVTTPNYSEPLLNEAYRQLADYYHFTIVPARVRAPKDKPSVEGIVGYISRQIIASLRKDTFFSLEELNQAILQKVLELVQEPFQKRPGSREMAFTEEEKSFLSPLRSPRFRQAEWRIALVNLNYHIQVHRMYYSVPYEYVKSEVEVKVTDDLIEVYFKERRIASHKRLYGEIGQMSTQLDHMPDAHRKYLLHTPQENLDWAQNVGVFTYRYVQYLIEHHTEKKVLRLLATFRNLVKNESDNLIELSCQTLMEVVKHPTNQLFQSILLRIKKQQSTSQSQQSTKLAQDKDTHGFVRGKDYFGGINP